MFFAYICKAFLKNRKYREGQRPAGCKCVKPGRYTRSVGASFHIEHFGCRAARADGEAIAERLRAGGLSESTAAEADVVVVNTCSVTAEADREARAFIRRAHRLNPTARILATGCYAQRAPEEVAKLAGVAAVVGNSHKTFAPEIALGLAGQPGRQYAFVPVARLLGGQADGVGRPQGLKPFIHDEAINRWAEARKIDAETPSYPTKARAFPGAPMMRADDRFAHSFLEEAQVVPGAQTRPNLKIQEGCGNRCSFCVIPQTRGSSRSLPPEKVLSQVRGFVKAGGKELVLSGINLGRWGQDITRGPRMPATFAELVRTILEETEIARLRLSSIEPMDWVEDLIALMAQFGGARLARHAHLPLQSGSDAVLRRMHRRYRPWHYAEKVAALVKAAGEELTLGADVMAGFPGETDLEFEETVELIRLLPFGYLHLFPFSPRPGTRAWALHAENPVPPGVVEERMSALRSLAAEKSAAHRAQFVGHRLDAITLHTPEAISRFGRSSALTENFLPVEIEGELPSNQLVRVRVTSFGTRGMLAVRAASSPQARSARL